MLKSWNSKASKQINLQGIEMNSLIIQENNNGLTASFTELKTLVDGYLYTVTLEGKARGTINTYRKKLNTFIEWYQSTPPTANIREHLLKYRNYLIERYDSAKTINLLITVVRNLYKWLFENNHITFDPTAKLKKVADNTSLKRSALTREQIQSIYSYLKEDDSKDAIRDRALFLIMVTTGMRINEACNFKIEDIVEVNGIKSIQLLRKGYIDKSNSIPLDDNTSEIISDYIGNKKKGYIFVSHRTGEQMTSDYMSRIIKRILKGAGYDSKLLSAHSLRHSFALLFLESGGAIEQLSILLNHKSITTTMNYLKSFDKSKIKVNLGLNLKLF